MLSLPPSKGALVIAVRTFSALAALALAVACAPPPEEPAPRQADGGRPADGGPEEDAGAPLDAGPDAGTELVLDAGPADAGPADAGPEDAGPADSGPEDAGPADAGPGDCGSDEPGRPPRACLEPATFQGILVAYCCRAADGTMAPPHSTLFSLDDAHVAGLVSTSTAGLYALSAGPVRPGAPEAVRSVSPEGTQGVTGVGFSPRAESLQFVAKTGPSSAYADHALFSATADGESPTLVARDYVGGRQGDAVFFYWRREGGLSGEAPRYPLYLASWQHGAGPGIRIADDVKYTGFAPDGRRIAWVGGPFDPDWGTGRLLVRDAVTDDAASTQLAGDASYFTWSSTGTHLAYVAPISIPKTLHVLRADSASEVLTIAASAVYSDIVFSPADTFLAYLVNNPFYRHVVRLHRMAEASTDGDWSFEVGNPDLVLVQSMVFAADEMHLFVTVQKIDGFLTLYTIDTSAPSAVQVGPRQPTTAFGGGGIHAIAQDDLLAMVYEGTDPQESGPLNLAPVGGGAATEIAPGAFSRSLAFSPDGERLLYLATGAYLGYGTPHVVSTTPPYGDRELPGYTAYDAAWVNGDAVVYGTNAGADGQDLVVVPLDGPGGGKVARVTTLDVRSPAHPQVYYSAGAGAESALYILTLP